MIGSENLTELERQYVAAIHTLRRTPPEIRRLLLDRRSRTFESLTLAQIQRLQPLAKPGKRHRLGWYTVVLGDKPKVYKREYSIDMDSALSLLAPQLLATVLDEPIYRLLHQNRRKELRKKIDGVEAVNLLRRLHPHTEIAVLNPKLPHWPTESFRIHKCQRHLLNPYIAELLENGSFQLTFSEDLGQQAQILLEQSPTAIDLSVQ